jgi:type IX secretion system PorP/SprF family membrane protein
MLAFTQKGTVVILLLFIAAKYNAQQSILLDQSAYNLFVLSPAAAGLSAGGAAHCHYKKNWLGLSDSPELMQFTIDGPLSGDKYAAGFSMANEKAGIFSKTLITGALRYRARLNTTNSILLGLSGGMQRQSADFSRIKADAPEEFTSWPQQQTTTMPEAGFGIGWQFRQVLLMASANQLLSQNFSFANPLSNSDVHLRNIPQFTFLLRNTFELKKETWFWTPHVTVRTPNGLPVQIDLVNTISYRNKIWLGVGYRYYYAWYGTLGIALSSRILFMYSYEYSQGIQVYTRGGHEIGIRFGLSNSGVPAPAETAADRVGGYEELLDAQASRIGKIAEKIDSMDSRYQRLTEEISGIRKMQISKEEISSAIDDFFSTESGKQNSRMNDAANSRVNANAFKFRMVNPVTGESYKDSLQERGSGCQIVLGAFQVEEFARQFQKLVRRKAGFETLLFAIPNDPKKFIYVCLLRKYDKLDEAIPELYRIRKEIAIKNSELTRGEAWILQKMK